MKHFVSTVLLASNLGLATAAQAQVQVSMGPRVGLNLSTVHQVDAPSYQYRPGFEAGLQGNMQLGHFALQPSVLYSQRRYALHLVSSTSATDPFAFEADGTYRRGYLSFPLHLVYTQRAGGQGWQAFAGPYLNLLVDGCYTTHTQLLHSPTVYDREGAIVAGYATTERSDNLYTKRVDAGAQAGLGYRRCGWLMQATYSLGLRNVAPAYVDTGTTDFSSYNRSLQFSLTRLFSLQR